MRILFAAASLIAILASVGLIAAQWWWPFGSDVPTDVLLDNQRLRLENENLVGESARLSAENESLRERLNELEREAERREPLEVEIERLRGELERARIALAEQSARAEQLERSLDSERQTRIRQDEILRNIRNGRGDPLRDPRGSLGWPAFLVLVLVLLASVAFWRERWWRSRILTTVPHVSVAQPGTKAVSRRVTGVSSVKVDLEDR